mgnify:FL=1|tara:strand:- start:1979 stop:3172 length:1194 start_codon:yes stop_codon:yes gene_type:complete
MLPNAFNLQQDDDRDFRPVAAALAKGFNTLRTFPDQQLNADLQNVMQQQTARKGRNKTIELLKSFGTPDMDRLAAMVQSGGLGAKDAYSLMFSMEAEQRAADRAKTAADLKYSRDLKLAELRSGGTGTTRYKNAIAAGLIPKTPEFERFMLTGKIDNSFEAEYRKTLTKPPAGQDYEFVYDDTGKFQNVRLVNIEGGKQEEEASKEDQARIATFTNQSRSGRIVLENIDRAIEIAMGTSMATGLRGQLLQNIGGTEARNLAKTIETVSATIGFDRLQRMRDESPTGGALGQVAVQELEALRATMGSLDITQDREIVVRNLQRVKGEYITSMKRIIDAAIMDNEKGLKNKFTGKVVSPYDFFSQAEVDMILGNDVETGQEGQASNVTVIDGYTIELSE